MLVFFMSLQNKIKKLFVVSRNIILRIKKKSKMLVVACRNIKQLLDDVEHDILNYQNRGLCYLPKPKAEADNTDTRA